MLLFTEIDTFNPDLRQDFSVPRFKPYPIDRQEVSHAGAKPYRAVHTKMVV